MVRSLDKQLGVGVQIWEGFLADVTLEQGLERCFRFGHVQKGVTFLVG